MDSLDSCAKFVQQGSKVECLLLILRIAAARLVLLVLLSHIRCDSLLE